MEKQMVHFDGLKVFSRTLARDREVLGEEVTRWISENKELEVVDCEIRQSSDKEFHCLSIIIFFVRK